MSKHRSPRRQVALMRLSVAAAFLVAALITAAGVTLTLALFVNHLWLVAAPVAAAAAFALVYARQHAFNLAGRTRTMRAWVRTHADRATERDVTALADSIHRHPSSWPYYITDESPADRTPVAAKRLVSDVERLLAQHADGAR